jgi:hypothetical protein
MAIETKANAKINFIRMDGFAEKILSMIRV